MIQPIGLSLLILLLITPVIYFTGNAESPFEIIRAEILSVISCLMFFQWMSRNYKQSDFIIRISKPGLLIHGLTISMFISFLLSINPYLSFWGTKALPSDSLRVALYVSIFVFVLDQINLQIKELRLILGSLNLVLFVQVVVGLLQIFGLDPNSWFHKEVFGTSGNTIKYATLLGILIINAVYFFLTTENKYYRAFTGLLLILSPYTALHSGSRTPILVTLAATISVLLYFSIKSNGILRKKIISTSLLIFSGVLIFIVDYRNSALHTKLSDSSFSHSLNLRKEVGEYAIESWKMSPIFGNGPETYVITQGRFQTPKLNHTNWRVEWSKAHNAVLHYLSNTGVVGTFFLASLFIYMMWLGIKLFFFGSRTETENLAFCLIVPYSLIFISNLTCFNCVYTQSVSAIFPVLAAKLLNIEFFSLNFSPLKKVYKLLLGLSLSGVVILTYFSFTYWYSDTIYQEGRRLREFIKDSKSAYDYFTRAIDVFPYEAYYYCGAAHSLNDLLVRNHLNLDTREKVGASGVIDSYVNECVDRAINRQHTIFLAAKVYLFQVDMGFTKDPKKTLALLYKALETTPQYPELYFRIGLMHAVEGDLTKYERSLKTAIENKIDYMPAYMGLAELYFKSNRPDEAKKIIQNVLEVNFIAIEFIPKLVGLAEISKQFGYTEGYDLIMKKYEVDQKKIPPGKIINSEGNY